MVIVSILARKGGTGKSTAIRCLAVEALKSGKTGGHYRRRPAAYLSSLVAAAFRSRHTGAAGSSSFTSRDRFPSRRVPEAEGRFDSCGHAADGYAGRQRRPRYLRCCASRYPRPNPEDLESVQESLRVAAAQKRKTGVVLWQAPPDKRVRAVSLAREALEAMGAVVCPTAVSASIAYPYAYAEGLTPQEREPDGRARAELAEVWAWLQRVGIVAALPYDIVAIVPNEKAIALPRDPVARKPRSKVASRSNGRSAA